MSTKLKPVIGLEIHIQLKTKSKMFCADDNSGENEPANTTISSISTGQPGTLPVANKKAIEWTVMAGLAFQCKIPAGFSFERKNYFYPDLPKGYQITSATSPPCVGGYLDIDQKGVLKKIRLHHIHLEEDAAKNFHSADRRHTLVDYNRAGTPLMEMVTEPDVQNAADAKKFLQELRLIMKYLDISDADMEKGHMRCDANISLTDEYDDKKIKKFYPKTEVKNLNSFKSVERALEYEIKRQTNMWEDGKTPHQATRGWNDDKGVTEEQRTKEAVHDYRYFPEPDIPPINFLDTKHIDVETIKLNMPELPQEKRKRFEKEFGMNKADVATITNDRELAGYFEQVISELREWLTGLPDMEGTKEEIWKNNNKKIIKLTTNWILNELLKFVNKDSISIEQCKVTPENFAEFITLFYSKKFNSTIAQKILSKMYETGKDPSNIIEEDDLSGGAQGDELEGIIELVIKANPEAVENYKKGKTNVIMFMVGQVMKETKGKADAGEVKMLIEKLLQ